MGLRWLWRSRRLRGSVYVVRSLFLVIRRAVFEHDTLAGHSSQSVDPSKRQGGRTSPDINPPLSISAGWNYHTHRK